jgi:hypothetical protein
VIRGTPLTPGERSVAGAFILAAGVGLGVRTVRNLAKGLHSRSWPATPGTVLESSSERTGRGYGAAVRYRYEVDGKEFVGSRLFIGDSVDRSASVIDGRIAQFPKGKGVSVFYDPDHPHVAVLEPGLKWSDWIMGAVIPIAFGVIGVAFLVL